MNRFRRKCCKRCLFYKKRKGFCEWTCRNVKRYVNIHEYACIGYVDKKNQEIRGRLYD